MIDKETMNRIYESVKTPYKLGAVLKKPGCYNDSPIVFKHNGKYYMSYIEIDDKSKGGYRTYIAESDDLIHFTETGRVLSAGSEWDKNQCGGHAQYIDTAFGGSNEIATINGKFVFDYLGGEKTGYETDPLSMGLATATDFRDDSTYGKLPRPILSGSDPDARYGERLTVYKADMFYDGKQTLGHPYVCAYNAKDTDNRESIFLAVSDDGLQYKRYGEKPIMDIHQQPGDVYINGDPQIVVIDGHYVMFYFVHSRPATYNTFAVSDNLTDWTVWDGAPLMQSEFEWENVYAHKQWIVKENGIVYHYYCAVNDKNERFIALAVSDKRLLNG